MYQEFMVNTKGQSIVGYHWPVERPSHAVCLIHGIGEYALCYDRMAAFMNGAGVAFVSMDLRGHGASGGVRGHCTPREAVLSDVDGLISQAQEFYPHVPLILYGHSMGGNIVLDYRSRGGLNYLPAGYVLSAPWIQLGRKIPGPLQGFARIMARVKPDFTLSAGVKAADLGNPQVIEATDCQKRLRHNRISVSAGLDGYDIADALAAGIHENNGGAAQIPMLLMHGDADKICYVEGSRKIAKLEGDCCTYIEWPGYYHEIHNGGPGRDGEEVIQAAISWIKGI